MPSTLLPKFLRSVLWPLRPYYLPIILPRIQKELKNAELLTVPGVLQGIGKDDIVIEGGAHFGESTYYLSQKAKFVYAFEPERLSFKVLRACAKRWHNVLVVNKALSDKKSTSVIKLLSNRSSRSSTIHGGYGMNYVTEEQIELTDIDSYNTKATVLILDVEGEEMNALKGAEKTLQTIKRVFVETHKLFDGTDTADETRKILANRGFQMREQKDADNTLWIFGVR